MLKILVILFSSVALSACSLLLPAKPYNPTLYTLDSANLSLAATVSRHATHKSILVLPVMPDQKLNNTRMLYVLKPHQIASFSNNIWAATPAQMLQPLIAQSLRASGNFYAVASAPFIGNVDYKIYSQLITLQQDFTIHPSIVTMTFSAQIVDANSGRIVAARQFHASVPAPQDNPYGGVIAANHATAEILQQLTRYTAAVTR